MLKQVQHDRRLDPITSQYNNVMGTKEFNIIDKLIAWMRLGKVLPFLNPNDTILDFGCGSQAYFLEHVKNKIRKGVGIDYDVASRNIAGNILVRTFHFKDKLPFVDSSFDKIFLLAVIEHIDLVKVPKLLRESNRILKKNGFLILTTPTLWGKIILEFLAFKLKIISHAEVSDHKKYYNKNDLENLAKNYGFEIVTYQTFQFGGNSLCVMRKI